MATSVVGRGSLGIGQVAALTGVPASAIRYYHELGLLPEPPRVSGRRRFRPETIDRLLLIRFCRRLGFRLSEMRALLLDPPNRRAKDVWRRLVDTRLEEVGALIQAAKAVERILRESRDCDCLTLASCRFLRDERQKPLPRSSLLR